MFAFLPYLSLSILILDDDLSTLCFLGCFLNHEPSPSPRVGSNEVAWLGKMGTSFRGKRSSTFFNILQLTSTIKFGVRPKFQLPCITCMRCKPMLCEFPDSSCSRVVQRFGAMAFRVFLLGFLLTSGAAPVGLKDVQRAKTKKPGADYRGHSQVAMSKKLNDHLIRAESSSSRTLPCEKWSLSELQSFMAMVAEHRSHELQLIYKSTMDRRSIRSESLPEFRSQWQRFNQLVNKHPHLHAPQKEAHCREAVMWWVHHLAEEKRQELRSRPNFSVPLLPEGAKKPCGQLNSDGGVAIDNGMLAESASDAEELCAKVNEANSCDSRIFWR